MKSYENELTDKLECAGKTIFELTEVLTRIVAEGSLYPPNYEQFTAEQKKQWPPVRSTEARIALDALTKINSTEAY